MTLATRINELNELGAFAPTALATDKDIIQNAPRTPAAIASYYATHPLTAYANREDWQTELRDLGGNQVTEQLVAALVIKAGKVIKYRNVEYGTPGALRRLARILSEIVADTAMEVETILAGLAASGASDAPTDKFDVSAIKSLLGAILKDRECTYDIGEDRWYKVFDAEKGRKGKVEMSEDQDIQPALETMVTIHQINTGSRISHKLVQAYLKDYKAQIGIDKAVELRQKIAFDGGLEAHRTEFLRRWYRMAKITYDFAIWETLISHQHWQLKRRAYGLGLGVGQPVMLGFHGRTGIGKTSLADKMYKPLFGTQYNADATLERLCDERNTPMFKTCLLINVEELAKSDGMEYKAGAGAQQMAQLKKIMTTDELTYRPMRTNTTERVPNLATLMFNANQHVYSVINDETGMRRFFEFVSDQPERTHFESTSPDDWAFLTDPTNVTNFMRSINEDNNAGFWYEGCSTWDDIRRIQHSYIKEDSFTAYLKGHCVPVEVNAKNADWVSRVSLVEQYRRFCDANGYTHPATNFDDRLERFCEGSSVSRKISNALHYRVKIVKEIAAKEKFQQTKPPFAASDFGVPATSIAPSNPAISFADILAKSPVPTGGF